MAPSTRPLSFGSFLFPKTAEGPRLLEQAALAEQLGYDLIAVPDHVDWGQYIDQWAVMGAIIGRTHSIEVLSCVAALALREPPAVLAKTALSLDALAPSRVHLGIGSGAAPGVAAVGGPQWSPGESYERVREAIELTRVYWSGEESGNYVGKHYRLDEAKLPPAPSAGLDIWIGCVKPRMRRLTAELADGWIPGMIDIEPEQIGPEVHEIDAALDAAGRPREAVRRVYNTIARKLQPKSEGFLVGPVDQWVEQLTAIALDFGFDTFLFGDRDTTVDALHVFADDVIPAVRDNVAKAVTGTTGR
jgi:alkanesulfonate monooxygenase SsuD/methylene tetrahydromethanopterin reductase-like flavin-dependent oxidoreductase (luciferase family)